MTQTYYIFNKYSSIFKTSTEYLINSSDSSRIMIPFKKEKGIHFLLDNNPFTLEKLAKYFSPKEIELLIQNYNILEYNDSIEKKEESILSRQRGFFSLVSKKYDSYETKIEEANILLLGAGAIGTHVFWNLLSIGVKNITIVDYDTVELSNLNRQLFYDLNDLGVKKIDVLHKKGTLKNKNLNIKKLDLKITNENQISELIKKHSFVIKAIDSPDEVTYWINNACVKYKKPYLAGGFLDNLGIVGPIYIPGRSQNCLNCYTLDKKTVQLTTHNGTLAPLTTIVASKISMLAMKIIIDDFLAPIIDKNFIYDFITDEWLTEKQVLLKDHCDTCNNVREQPKEEYINNRFLALAIIINLISSFLSIYTNQPHFLYAMPMYFIFPIAISFKEKRMKNKAILNYNFSFVFILSFLIIGTIVNRNQLFIDSTLTTILTTIVSLFTGGVIFQTILFWVSTLLTFITNRSIEYIKIYTRKLKI